MRRIHELVGTVLPVLISTGNGLCAAAPASSGAVTELAGTVVTGELWESELERTTASVTVLDAAVIDNPAIGHFADVTELVPNLTATGGTSRPRYIQIRGIGENSQFEGETPDSAVRFLVDDLDFTGLGTVGGLFDVQQVEVLRGPQAGAFGANAAGGVIRIVTNGPSAFWTGTVEGSVGSDDLFAGGIAVGGPLIEDNPERLTFRLAVQQYQSNGYIENRTLGREDTNQRDEFGSRLRLRWAPDSDWVWEGTLFYADVDNGYDEFSLTNSDFETFSDEPGRDAQESLAGSVKGVWEGPGAVRFTTVTSATSSDSIYSYDADWTPDSYRGFLSTDRTRVVFNQELRFDSVAETDALGWIDRWSVGGYLHLLDEDSAILYRDGDPAAGSFGFGQVDVDSNYVNNGYALFGQVAHDFSERTRLTLGARVEYQEVEFASESFESGYYVGVLESGTSDQEDVLYGGKITLEHDLDSARTVFVSAARGYKAGGANSATFRMVGNPLSYSDETLWNFETGLRGRWFGERLSTRVTAFYLYRDGVQVRDSEGAGGFFQYLTVNGDSAYHYGLETEGRLRIADGWDLNFGLGLLETERSAYDDPGGRVVARDLANAPTYSWNLRLSYQQGIEGWLGSMGLAGRDGYFESNSHDEIRNAYTVLNATLGYRWDGWTFSLWARNLLDEKYEDRVFLFDNGEGVRRYEALADPVQIGATLRYGF